MSYGNSSNNLCGGMLGAGAAEAKADSPVEVQLRLLNEAACDLDSAVADLVRRLNPIRSMSPPVPVGINQATSPIPSFGDSEVETGIGTQRDRINAAVSELRRLLRELRV